MRRSLLLGGLILLLAGCSKAPPPVPQPVPQPDPGPVVVNPNPNPNPTPDATRQERYDAALLDAYAHLARGEYAEALEDLEAAQAASDTEQIRAEIDRVRTVLEQQRGAARAIADIRAVLQDGNAEEAARLAGQALLLYGSSESAAELTQLKRQADALLAAGAGEDRTAQAARLRREVEAALTPDVNNLRAAVVALEQLDAVDDSPEVDRQLAELRQRLNAYDAARQRAQELRVEPGTLEDAIEQFETAALAWDTFQVRQEIEECNRALALRKPRIAVADFDVRGGMAADVGETIAEELLPAFKGRYDLVERRRLANALEELKLDAEDAVAADAARAELARRLRARYLVLGSLNDLGGLAINARLIDLETGLVVQTGRVLAAALGDVRAQLPALAALLQMTDEEKLAHDAKLLKEQQAVKPVEAAVIPPAPEPLQPGQPAPPPVVTVTIVPPPLGRFGPDDLDVRLPNNPPPLDAQADPDEAFRDRLLVLLVEVGDNHLRRGRFVAAFRCFDLAVGLAGPRPELRVRLDLCRPFLPPDFALVPPRPRVAVLNFATFGRIPPGLDHWTADALTCYVPAGYEAVPRGELFWYMGRLGLSTADVVFNPSARRWLARALGVRFFVVGSLHETASFDVRSHLVDAEYGWAVGRARIHVRDAWELKLRLPELARRLALSPLERMRLEDEARLAELELKRLDRLPAEERLRFVRGSANFHLLLAEARRASAAEDYRTSIELLEIAQRLRPESVEVATLLQRDRDRLRTRELADRWKAAQRRDRDVLAEIQRKQLDLARAVEEARARAEREAAQQAEAQRRAREAEREKAHADVLVRARRAYDGKRYDLAISLYRDALDLKNSPEAVQGLAAARAARDKEKQLAEAAEKARQETELRRKREAELAALQAKLEAERKAREQQEALLREAQATRDKEAFARLLQEAQTALRNRQLEPAMNALTTARRLRPEQGKEVDVLWSKVLDLQHSLALEKLESNKQAEAERKFQAEREARERAQREALANQTKYRALLDEARKASGDGKHDLAVARYEEALKLFRTEEAQTGLQRARDALERVTAAKDEAARRAAETKKLRDDGLAAVTAREYAKAKLLLTEFNKRSPGDLQVLAALSQAEQALGKAQADARREEERKQREADFARLLASAKNNLAIKQHAAAAIALREALRLKPDDREAKSLLEQAEKAQPTVSEAEKKKLEQFQKLVAEGRQALTSKQFERADRVFTEAKRLLPDEPSLPGLLGELKKARDAEAARIAAEAARRDAEARKAKEFTDALLSGRLALGKRDLNAARNAIKAAADLQPNHPDVKKAQADLVAVEAQVKAEADALRARQTKHAGLLTKARDLLRAKKPEEALKVLAEAGDLLPNDPGARTLKAEAEAAIQAQLKGRIDALIGDARKAMGTRDFIRANQFLREAKQLGPTDRDVAQALADLDKLLKTPTVDPKVKADYEFAMKSGQDAMSKKNYAGAVNSYREALRLMRGDKEATAKLAEAERLLAEATRGEGVKKALDAGQAALRAGKFDEARNAVNDALRLQPDSKDAARLAQDIRTAEDAARKTRFTQLVTQAKGLLAAKKSVEAVPVLEAALKLAPTDREALALLKQAKEGPPQPPMPNPQADYQKHMTAGAGLERLRKFVEAEAAYKEALKARPNDTVAKVALQRVQAAQAIATNVAAGNAALRAGKWADAEKAFNEVLKIDPRNADAREGLQKARNKRP